MKKAFDGSAQLNWSTELNEMLDAFYEHGEKAGASIDEILAFVEDLVCESYIRGRENAKKD